VSKISKSKVENGATGSPQKRRKGLKIIEDEDKVMEDNTTPIPEENKQRGI
jgi:hypothetical protein